jgi:hypothetical protein
MFPCFKLLLRSLTKPYHHLGDVNVVCKTASEAYSLTLDTSSLCRFLIHMIVLLTRPSFLKGSSALKAVSHRIQAIVRIYVVGHSISIPLPLGFQQAQSGITQASTSSPTRSEIPSVYQQPARMGLIQWDLDGTLVAQVSTIPLLQASSRRTIS